MKALLALVGERIGWPAVSALVIIASGAAFLGAVVQPLERRALLLEQEVSQAARPKPGLTRVSNDTQAAQLQAFYRHFEREEVTVEWLGKLQGMGTAAGLTLRSADYRLAQSRHNLARYQITLPVQGSYTQIRTFMEDALADVPILSLDQVNFRRRSSNDSRVEAEIVFTLHLLQR